MTYERGRMKDPIAKTQARSPHAGSHEASDETGLLRTRIEMPPGRVTRWLFSISVALLLCNLGVQISRYRLGHGNLRGLAPVFDLNGEANIPAFFSALLLVSATTLLALVARVERRREARFSRHWQILTVIFAYLAIDEAAQLHEKVALNVADLVGDGGYPAFYAWVLPFAIFVAILGVAYLPFLRTLAPRFRRIFIIAGLVYVGSALGLEVVDAGYTSLFGFDNLTHRLLYSAEEVGEMWGVILFIYGLLAYLREEGVFVETSFFTQKSAT